MFNGRYLWALRPLSWLDIGIVVSSLYEAPGVVDTYSCMLASKVLPCIRGFLADRHIVSVVNGKAPCANRLINAAVYRRDRFML